MKKLSLILFMLLFGMRAYGYADPVFYPQAPNEPKIQHLVGFSSIGELQPLENWFFRFVMGDDTAPKKSGLNKPYGVKVWKDKLFVCDPASGIAQSIDLSQDKAEAIGAKGVGKLSHPVSLDADNQRIYIADKNRGIAVYENKSPYKFIAVYGIEGQFSPVAVKILDDKLVVSDIKDHEIEVLNKETGKLLYKFGGRGIEDGKFKFPIGLAIDTQKRLYVVDSLNFRFQVFSLDNEKSTHLLSFGKMGQAVTDLSRPKGIAVDPDGRIWITDVLVADNAQVLSSVVKVFGSFEELKDNDLKNDFVLAFGGEGGGTQPGDVFMPVALDISADTESLEAVNEYSDVSFVPEFVVVVINQLQGSSEILKKLNIYTFGHKKEADK